MKSAWGKAKRDELVGILRDRKAEMPKYEEAVRTGDAEKMLTAIQAQAAIERRALATVSRRARRSLRAPRPRFALSYSSIARPRHRQLRLVHVQPRAVPGRARRGHRRREERRHRRSQASQRSAPDGVLVSPGPCTPNDAGISLAAVAALRPSPVLGVCLGHQAIGQAFGGKVVRADRLMHGRTSPILHEGKGVFAGLPSPFEATRYHSLIVERAIAARRASRSPRGPPRARSWACGTRSAPSRACSSIRRASSRRTARSCSRTGCARSARHRGRRRQAARMADVAPRCPSFAEVFARIESRCARARRGARGVRRDPRGRVDAGADRRVRDRAAACAARRPR